MSKNRKRLAEAFDALAEAAARVSIELSALDAEDATSAQDASGRLPFDDDLPGIVVAESGGYVADEAHPQGSLAVCPVHGKPFEEGRYGPYCRQKSDIPGWSNERGYCQLTPKNAAAYLRKKAAAA